MSDPVLRHWHGIPSTLADPADCCKDAFVRVLDYRSAEADRRLDQAVNDERKRVILDAVATIEAYSEGALSVLDGEKAALVATVVRTAVTAIKRTGCICPDCDVSTFGEAPGTSFVKGRDGRCGMHEDHVVR